MLQLSGRASDNKCKTKRSPVRILAHEKGNNNLKIVN
jgi:hypothetical protein